MLQSKLVLMSDYSIKLNALNSTSEVTYCYYNGQHYLIIDRIIYEVDTIVNILYLPSPDRGNITSWGIFFIEKGSNDGCLLGIDEQGKHKFIKFHNSAHNGVLLDLTVCHLSFILEEYTEMKFSKSIDLPAEYKVHSVSMLEVTAPNSHTLVSYGDNLLCAVGESDVEWIDVNNIGFTVTRVDKSRDKMRWESRPIQDYLSREIHNAKTVRYECDTTKNVIHSSDERRYTDGNR